ncbi:hypothetical protein WOLCODRAFT_159128 [Wolfiporia cocos MD-104 SS10]|uniref:Fungal-type protein kinase domain-containing protein n=1 Tax=Wolfiporia cocos (strain MD-104) TaxID=742152 RepID=A0A2H3JBA1_WOLCO|nr:hypothetical protein WOLCODRAFT_159128 [Wolfiporia cocos MD-104 SS10]
MWGKEDIKIDLDGLRHRYLKNYPQCIDRPGAKRKRGDKVDPEMIKPGKRARLSTENVTEATNTRQSRGHENTRKDANDTDGHGWEIDGADIQKISKQLGLTDDEAQMLKYINEQMSHNVRSYGSGILFRDMTLQLWYADRMGIIVSRPIHMIEEPELLLYTVAAMGQADIYQMGICHLMEFNTSKRKFTTYRNAKLVLDVDQDVKDSGGEDVREPLEFEVTAKNENDVFTDFGIVGRGTTVVPVRATGHAVNVCGSGELVAKIAWPVKRQNRDETECIRKIRKVLAEEKPSILKHIVELKCYLSREIDELELPRAYLGTRVLDERIFRTMILEKYDRLEAMNNAAEFKIIFVDVVRAHRWVYKETNILHQDISSNNVMFYRDGRSVRGVLCDWDQAAAPVDDPEESEDQSDDPAWSVSRVERSTDKVNTLDWKASLLAEGSFIPKNVGKPSRSKAQDVPEAESGTVESQLPPEPLRYRTGTAPFMAIDLLAKGSVSAHRYRHDLESFFYLLVYVCATFDVKQHRLGHIYEWESADLAQVGEKKETFLKNPVVFNDTFQNQTDPGFKDLAEGWAKPLRRMLFRIANKSPMLMYLREERDDLVKCRPNEDERCTKSFAKEHEIRSKIRQLKAEQNEECTYEEFMKTIGEDAI